MNDGEKMWTVEISFGGPPKPEQPISKPSEPLSTPRMTETASLPLSPRRKRQPRTLKSKPFCVLGTMCST